MPAQPEKKTPKKKAATPKKKAVEKPAEKKLTPEQVKALAEADEKKTAALEKNMAGPSEEEIYGQCVVDLKLIIDSLQSVLGDVDGLKSDEMKAKPLFLNRARVRKAGEVLGEIYQKAAGE